ncbi:MAG: hypothetical protein M5U26_19465 [Planctomycetota bacterium]|nr:hypothetical protein [Planctomycetota bacterium]
MPRGLGRGGAARWPMRVAALLLAGISGTGCGFRQRYFEVPVAESAPRAAAVAKPDTAPSFVNLDPEPPAAPKSVKLPALLRVWTTPDLSPERQRALAWHYRNAAALAPEFAAREGLTLARAELPDSLHLSLDASGVAQATGSREGDGERPAAARVSPALGMLYLGGPDPQRLYAALALWLFRAPASNPEGRLEAIERGHAAERFARYCLNPAHWREPGGSSGPLW